ncbi:MAG: DNA polymerase III subunit gamma/tau [Eubacteriaceae bacterium]|nr:DNA polymerase III subunit gamma/tau [Eubacteriaceae bacterium]
MSHQALYREYRPNSFKDICGQDVIISILKNQIISGNLSHAYLFSGSRGTGKTSTARVFAKAATCHNPIGAEACNACPSCLSYEANPIDLSEIDAASNRGIDEARDLREKANFLPVYGKYRIYIVDEVHMLTNEAFNALLKLLEEPPEHVIFIFATTEPNKVPATILSRCQHHGFIRIPLEAIASRLAFIAQDMGREVEPAAIDLISSKSDGALRDAIGFLEKAMALGDGIVTIGMSREAMGLQGSTSAWRLAQCILSHDTGGALVAVNELVMAGTDIANVYGMLIDYYRGLLIFTTVKDYSSMLNASREELDSYRQSAAYSNVEIIIAFIRELSKSKNEARYFENPRVLLEAIVVSLSFPATAAPNLKVATRLEALEKVAFTGAVSQPQRNADTTIAPSAIPAPEPIKTSPEKALVEGPAPSAGASLAEAQMAISEAAKHFGAAKDLVLREVFEGMRATRIENGTLFVCPTGDGIGLMELFVDKNGFGKLAEYLAEKHGINYNVLQEEAGPNSAAAQVAAAESEEDYLSAATEMFNLEEIDGI